MSGECSVGDMVSVPEAVDAIKALDVAGAPSFITCESGGVRGPCVVVRFASVEQAQSFHRALIQCGEAAR